VPSLCSVICGILGPVKFHLIDAILEQSADRIVAIKQVSLAEDYLADHFPSFPVLPGVLMIEAMVQAARAMLPKNHRLVLGEVKALKFGNMVRPGEALEVEVTLSKQNDDGSYTCKGVGTVRRRGNHAAADTAVSGRFTMRPVRTSPEC
jgi:3-hydroxyacyl-[acyl-carrier-protein] dehydratase